LDGKNLMTLSCLYGISELLQMPMDDIVCGDRDLF